VTPAERLARWRALVLLHAMDATGCQTAEQYAEWELDDPRAGWWLLEAVKVILEPCDADAIARGVRLEAEVPAELLGLVRSFYDGLAPDEVLLDAEVRAGAP
jgi:hypothetical protein